MPHETPYQRQQRRAREDFARRQRENLARSGYAPGGNPADYQQQPAAPAPAPADPGGPPVDPAYEAQKAANLRALQLGNAFDTYQTGRINADYGFDASGGIDLNNPYSRAAQARERYLQQQAGTGTSFASQGQLYSGALQNAQAYNTRQFDVGIDQLKKQQADALMEILRGKVGRYSQVGVEDSDQGLASLLKALGGG